MEMYKPTEILCSECGKPILGQVVLEDAGEETFYLHPTCRDTIEGLFKTVYETGKDDGL